MKYIVFFIAVFAGIPILTLLVNKFKQIENLTFYGLILSTAEMIDINFYSLEHYKGTSNGFEFGLIDILTYVFFFTVLKRWKSRGGAIIPKGSMFFGLYIFLSFLSIINSDYLVVSFMEIWTLFRIFTFYWVIYNYISQIDDLSIVFRAICVNFLYIFLICIKLRYFDGRFQVAGPFAHQNGMVVYLNLLAPVILSIFFNAKKSSFLYPIAFSAASICILLSLSRGGMLCYSIAVVLTIFPSVIFRPSIRKFVTLAFITFGASLILLKSWDSITERFSTAPKESGETRVTLIHTAINMANSNILGVGLNNFPIKGVYPYPYAKHKYNPHYGERNPKTGKRMEQSAKPETIYGLIMAESGYITLASYILFILYFLIRALIYIVWKNSEKLNFLYLGLFSGLVAVYTQGVLEWSLKYPEVNYMQMMVYSLIAILPKKVGKSIYSTCFQK